MKKYLIPILSVFFLSATFVFAAPVSTILRNVLPETDNTYDLGSTTPAAEWKNIYTKNLTVSGTCTGCGSSSFGTSSLSALWPIIYTQSSSLAQFSFDGLSTTSPWTNLQLVQVASNGTISSIATSSLNLTTSSFLSPNISQWTNNSGYFASYDAWTHPQAGTSATTSGMILAASSTIGDSTQTGGLTVSGGATTTGNLIVQGNATSTFDGDLTMLHPHFLTTHALRGDASDGLMFVANNYTSVANFGAAGSANASFYGGVNIDGQTRLATSLTGLLKATSGVISTATAGTDYLASYDAWTHPSAGISATTSNMLFSSATSTFAGGLTFLTGTSTSATSTNFFATTASTTNLFGQLINGFGLSTCTGTNALTWTSGSFTCTAQPQGTVTSVTATWPIISSGGATPAITWDGIATSSAIAAPQVLYATGVNTFASVATGTVSGGSGITVTGNRYVLGGALAIDCAGASASQNGCLSSTDWSTFNSKGSGTVTSVGVGSTGSTLTITSSPITTSGTINGEINLGHSNTWLAQQLFTAPSGFGTSTPWAQLSIATTTSQNTVPLFAVGSSTVSNIPFQINGFGKVISTDQVSAYTGVDSPLHNLAVQMATTTAWTGTSTAPYSATIVMPFAGTLRDARCKTDAGTLEVQTKINSTILTYMAITSTQALNNFSSSNTFVAGDVLTINAGNPASSPTTLLCTYRATETP